MNFDPYQPPTLGEKIRCDCHGRGCHATVRATVVGAMVELEISPVTVHDKKFSILLDQHHARAVAILLSEAATDASDGGTERGGRDRPARPGDSLAL